MNSNPDDNMDSNLDSNGILDSPVVSRELTTASTKSNMSNNSNSKCACVCAGLLATPGSDRNIDLWSARTHTHITSLYIGDEPDWFAFSPDNTLLASSADESNVKIWDLASSYTVMDELPNSKHVGMLCFNRCGDRLVIKQRVDESIDAVKLQVYDVSSRRICLCLDIISVDSATVCFSADGELIIGTCKRTHRDQVEALLKIWNSSTGEEVRCIDTGHTEDMEQVLLSPDGSILATASNDSSIKIWDAATWSDQPIAVLLGHSNVASCVAFSPTGDRLVSGSFDKTAVIWCCETWSILVRIQCVHEIWDIGFSPDGSRVCTLVCPEDSNKSFVALIYDSVQGGFHCGLTSSSGLLNGIRICYSHPSTYTSSSRTQNTQSASLSARSRAYTDTQTQSGTSDPDTDMCVCSSSHMHRRHTHSDNGGPRSCKSNSSLSSKSLAQLSMCSPLSNPSHTQSRTGGDASPNKRVRRTARRRANSHPAAMMLMDTSTHTNPDADTNADTNADTQDGSEEWVQERESLQAQVCVLTQQLLDTHIAVSELAIMATEDRLHTLCAHTHSHTQTEMTTDTQTDMQQTDVAVHTRTDIEYMCADTQTDPTEDDNNNNEEAELELAHTHQLTEQLAQQLEQQLEQLELAHTQQLAEKDAHIQSLVSLQELQEHTHTELEAQWTHTWNVEREQLCVDILCLQQQLKDAETLAASAAAATNTHEDDDVDTQDMDTQTDEVVLAVDTHTVVKDTREMDTQTDPDTHTAIAVAVNEQTDTNNNNNALIEQLQADHESERHRWESNILRLQEQLAQRDTHIQTLEQSQEQREQMQLELTKHFNHTRERLFADIAQLKQQLVEKDTHIEALTQIQTQLQQVEEAYKLACEQTLHSHQQLEKQSSEHTHTVHTLTHKLTMSLENFALLEDSVRIKQTRVCELEKDVEEHANTIQTQQQRIRELETMLQTLNAQSNTQHTHTSKHGGSKMNVNTSREHHSHAHVLRHFVKSPMSDSHHTPNRHTPGRHTPSRHTPTGKPPHTPTADSSAHTPKYLRCLNRSADSCMSDHSTNTNNPQQANNTLAQDEVKAVDSILSEYLQQAHSILQLLTSEIRARARPHGANSHHKQTSGDSLMSAQPQTDTPTTTALDPITPVVLAHRTHKNSDDEEEEDDDCSEYSDIIEDEDDEANNENVDNNMNTDGGVVALSEKRTQSSKNAHRRLPAMKFKRSVGIHPTTRGLPGMGNSNATNANAATSGSDKLRLMSLSMLSNPSIKEKMVMLNDLSRHLQQVCLFIKIRRNHGGNNNNHHSKMTATGGENGDGVHTDRTDSELGDAHYVGLEDTVQYPGPNDVEYIEMSHVSDYTSTIIVHMVYSDCPYICLIFSAIGNGKAGLCHDVAGE
jgi:WD40 repeat protein